MEDHNEKLIELWNETVSPTSIIIHLGDFAFGHSGKACSILPRLSGIKILVPGNHDGKNLKSMEFKSFWRYITGPILELDLKELFLVLCHYPIESWNHMYHNSIHLHGHCHSNREQGLKPRQVKNRLDVGVDYHGLRPISLPEVLSELATHNEFLTQKTLDLVF